MAIRIEGAPGTGLPDLNRLADLAAAKVQQAWDEAWNDADAAGTRPRALLTPRGAY